MGNWFAQKPQNMFLIICMLVSKYFSYIISTISSFIPVLSSAVFESSRAYHITHRSGGVSQRPSTFFSNRYPAGIKRWNNVESTLFQPILVELTLMQRCFNVWCLLGIHRYMEWLRCQHCVVAYTLLHGMAHVSALNGSAAYVGYLSSHLPEGHSAAQSVYLYHHDNIWHYRNIT